MAYASVISLKQTIQRLLNSSHISILPPSPEILEFAYKEVKSLQEVLERLDSSSSSEKVNALDGQIREAVCKLEDTLESHVSNQFPSQSESHPLLFSLNLQGVNQDIDSFTKTVKKLEEEYIDELCNPLPEEDDAVSLTNACAKELLQFGVRVRSEKERSEVAYDALISVKQTIERHLNSSHISLVPPSPEILESAYKEVQSLQEVLERLNGSSSSERVNALDRQITEAVCKLWDSLKSYVANQILSQSERPGDETDPLLFSIDLQEIKKDIDSFTQMVMKMEEYIKELSTPLPEESDLVSSRIDFGGKKSNIVGLADLLSILADWFSDDYLSGLLTCAVVGMAGIGKTTLVKEIFKDPTIWSQFNCCAFVTIGPKYQLKKILHSILAQVNPDTDEMLTERDEILAEHLYESLKGRRCLIVLDDVWNGQVWDDLKPLIPDDHNGNRVLLTTRLHEVEVFASRYEPAFISMPFLNKEESWNLLCEKVFDEESCPPQLKKAGKKIAENCEGLPLLIVTVAELLSKAEKTPEYWNKVADKQNSVFIDANDKISEVLFPSYNYLPQYLKACFLYMGVFPQNYEIPHSKLIKLWCAEGFLEPDPSKTVEDFSVECLTKLVSRSLVMVHQQSFSYEIKTCGLHSVYWHFCIREAGKNKFSHVLNSYVDGSAEGIKIQRRLCIHKNVLFGIKDVYNSMTSISTARSLLCTGPHHQYPVPICFGLRLLRVLDALTIRFYEFPMEVLKLVQLRYLALTYNGELPHSISELWNLQCLIVCRCLSIISSGAPLYLPVEIWDMQELKHLQFMGSDLPDPCGALLPNLLTLLNVSAHSCTKGVLERIPSLKKLGIQIELASDAAEPLCRFDHISLLHELETLKCVIVNPKLRSAVVAPPAPLSIFPSGLKKLTLSGFGYPWEDMSKIASLPNLEVLKLRCYAFQGPKWEVEERMFRILRFLLIEDTDLVHWRVGYNSFPFLLRLSIKHCYKLEQIHWESYGLQVIELVDCNPLTVTWAKQTQERVRTDVNVHSSWLDGNLKS